LLAYSTIGVNHMPRSIAFYDAVFTPLGVVRDTTSDTWTGYSRKGEAGKFFLSRPFDRAMATGGNGAMLAFLAADRAAIDAFYAAALDHGGSDEGPPGVRDAMNPVFYAAYVRDPDGNKLCAFVRK
jgi:catechol 2,3-dioxygenase-like lactoylglutathione lyase family enzyme